MRKFNRILKKVILSLIGFPILIVGLILIPLPGPGVLISILGLFILSFAFESIKPHLEKYKKVIYGIYKNAKEKEAKFVDKHK